MGSFKGHQKAKIKSLKKNHSRHTVFDICSWWLVTHICLPHSYQMGTVLVLLFFDSPTSNTVPKA